MSLRFVSYSNNKTDSRRNLLKQVSTTPTPISPSRLTLLKVADVAAMLNVQPSTVYEWVRMDYIPHIRLGTGKEKPCIRFDAQEVLEWLNARKNEGRTSRLPKAC